MRRKKRFVRCPGCGSKIYATRTVCPGCGRQMTEAVNKKKRKKAFLVGALLAAVLVVAIILGARYIIKRRTEISLDVHIKTDARLYGVTGDAGFERLSTEQKKQKLEDCFKKLKDNGLVDSFSYNETEQIYEFTYEDGSLGAAALCSFDKELCGIDKSYKKEESDGSVVIDSSLDLQALGYSFEKAPTAKVFGFYGSEKLEKWAKKRSEIWERNGMKTELDTEVTAKKLEKQLSKTDLVILDAHGFVFKNDTALCFGEKVTKASLQSYSKELRSGQMIELLTPEGKYLCVMPALFRTHYAQGALDKTVVVLGACCTADKDEPSKVMRELGAKAVAAVNGRIFSGYLAQFEDAFVYSLLCGDSVGEAVDFAKSVYGADDALWAMTYDGTPLALKRSDKGSVSAVSGADKTLVKLKEIS